MPTILSVLALLTYSAASVLLVADLRADRPRTRALGRFWLDLSTGLVVLAVLSVAITRGPIALFSRTWVFLLVAVVIAVGGLGLRLQFSHRVIGAATAPVASFLLALQLLEVQRVAGAESELGLVLVVHVGLALLGLGIFGLAAALSALYLLQDRQLRHRRFGSLFQKLPSLEELDTAGFRLVVLGFATYSVGLVIGGVEAWFVRDDGFDLRMLLAFFAWLVFAAVVHLRLTSGWRGRQSSWMTVVGFLSALLVLLFYSFP
ncbi:MAG: hypothetical protein EA398_16560 [Deltaproteobacteria bacterium]|nr:MAG: hypothetical protein EA398_16560 [Deltaproteobacteria bacterium]